MTIITGSTQKIQQGSAVIQYVAAFTGKKFQNIFIQKTSKHFFPPIIREVRLNFPLSPGANPSILKHYD